MEEDILIPGEPIYYSHTLSPTLKRLEIVPISDVHYGNHLFSKSHFLRTVNYIAEHSYAYTVLPGDLCESSIRTSKGEIYNQVGSPQKQRDWIIDKLKPIKKKILGITIGNHELRIYNEVGIDICKDIAKELHVPYRPEGLLLKISFGDNNNYTSGKPFVYWGYVTHGYGGARTKSAKAVKVERTASWIHADFYIMCLSEDTEILTRDGWKGHGELREEEEVLTLNRDRGHLEYNPIQSIHRYNNFTQLTHLWQKKGVDILATDKHRIIYRWGDKYLEKPLGEFAKLSGQVDIPRCGYYEETSGIDYSDNVLKLSAWVITEGHFRKDSSAIDIRQQADSPHCARIRGILRRSNIKWSEYKVDTKGKEFYDPNANKTYRYNHDTLTFHISAEDGKLVRHWVSEKRIPREWQEMDDAQYELFMAEMMMGDGYKDKQYSTSDKVLADQVQELAFKHGKRATIYKEKKRGKYTVTFTKNVGRGIIPKRDVETVAYKGIVWCVSVANGTIVVRRNGRAYVIGNSHDHVVNVAPDIYLLPDNRTRAEKSPDGQETGFTIGKVVAHRKMLIKSNAYLKWGGYSELGGFPPVDLETPIIKLSGQGKPRVRVEV